MADNSWDTKMPSEGIPGISGFKTITMDQWGNLNSPSPSWYQGTSAPPSWYQGKDIQQKATPNVCPTCGKPW